MWMCLATERESDNAKNSGHFHVCIGLPTHIDSLVWFAGEYMP
jgi:hypothetical protein